MGVVQFLRQVHLSKASLHWVSTDATQMTLVVVVVDYDLSKELHTAGKKFPRRLHRELLLNYCGSSCLKAELEEEFGSVEVGCWMVP